MIPKAAVLLCRISDARDDDTGGVDRQVKRLIEKGRQLGWGWDDDSILIENDTSAFKRKKIELADGSWALRTVRPKFRRALAMLASGEADGLLAVDLDRVVRDPRDLEDLIDVVESRTPRVLVDSVTGSLRLANTADIAMARVMVAMANKSSSDTARRVKDRRKEQAESGVFGGGTRPYGFGVPAVDAKGRHYLDMSKIVPAEAIEIVRASEAVLVGATIRSLAADLRKRGVPTVTGVPWKPETLRGILLRPRNAGLVLHRGVVLESTILEGVDEEHPPIVSRTTWEAVCAILTSEHRQTTPGRAPKWLGSGLYLCGHPDCVGKDPRPTVHSAGSGGEKRVAYVCAGPKEHLTRTAEPLDQYVVAHLTGLMSDRAAAHLLRPDTHVDIAALEIEATSLETRIRTLGDLAESGDMGDVEYRTRRKRLQVALDEIAGKLKGAAKRDPLVGFAGNPNAGKIWPTFPLAIQRAILADVLRVTILPVPRGQGRPKTWVKGEPYFNPDSVKLERIR